MTELALVKTEEPKEIESLKTYELQIADIKRANAEFVFDLNDPKQYRACRSHIDRLRSTKAAVTKAAKLEREEALAKQRQVIAKEKSLVGEVQEMIDHHLVPLEDYDAKQKARQDMIRQLIEDMTMSAEKVINKTAEELLAMLDKINHIDIDDGTFEEYRSEAFAAKMVAVDYLHSNIAIAVKREAEAAELERFKAEAEARRLADEEAARKAEELRLAKEKAERDAQEAKTRAEEEAKRAEAEAAKIAKAQEEARAAAIKEADEREDKLKAELAAAAAKAEKEAKEAATRRTQEAEEAEKRQAAAVEAERKRQADEQAAKEAEENRKAADRAHRGKIHGAIVKAMMALPEPCAISEVQAKAIVIAVCGGEIPELKILY